MHRFRSAAFRSIGPGLGFVPSRRLTVMIFLGLMTAACAGAELKTDRQIARDRVEAYLAAHPDTGKETARTMRRFELLRGMSKQEVAAVWGKPVRIQEWRDGTFDQWSFGCAWPNRCELPRRRTLTEEPIRPEAYFRNDRLAQWSSP